MPVVMPLARVLAEEGASVVEACMVEWDRRGFGTSRGEDGAAAWRRSVYSAFGQLSVEARGAMVEVLGAAPSLRAAASALQPSSPISLPWRESSSSRGAAPSLPRAASLSLSQQ